MNRRNRMLSHGGKHWTIDCGTVDGQSLHYTDVPHGNALIENRGGSANIIPAFLLRPISRNSVRSQNGQNKNRPLSISPRALSAAVAAASGNVKADASNYLSTSNKDLTSHSNDALAANYQYWRVQNRSQLNKKRPSNTIGKINYDAEEEEKRNLLTADYNPKLSENILKRHRLHLVRQHSDAGAYEKKSLKSSYITSNMGKLETKHQMIMDSVISSKLMRSSHSHPGIAMLRDNSCSLVDIPTYLGPSLQACGGVEVLTVTQDNGTKWNIPTSSAIPSASANHPMIPHVPCHSNFRDQSKMSCSTNKKRSFNQQKYYPPKTLPKLDIDEREKQILREKLKLKKQRKAKCTVLCVSLLLLTMCVTLVGTMLSFGSKYQVIIELNIETIVYNLYHWI